MTAVPLLVTKPTETLEPDRTRARAQSAPRGRKARRRAGGGARTADHVQQAGRKLVDVRGPQRARAQLEVGLADALAARQTRTRSARAAPGAAGRREQSRTWPSSAAHCSSMRGCDRLALAACAAAHCMSAPHAPCMP